jgi:hypothetical protein
MPRAKKIEVDAPNKVAPFVRLFVADEVRVEASGKLMAIGLYGDGVLLVQQPSEAPDPTQDVPYAIDSLCLVITIGGSSGQQDVRVSIGGQKVADRSFDLQPGRSVNLLLQFRPFLFSSFGVKHVEIEFAGTKHSQWFEVRSLPTDQAIPPSVIAPHLLTPARSVPALAAPASADQVAARQAGGKPRRSKVNRSSGP